MSGRTPPDDSELHPAPGVPDDPEGTEGQVLPIRGWNRPLRCPCCRGEDILQVDVVECAYPVRGERRPWGFVVVDVSASSLDPSATHAEFFRCRECRHEWPVESGTRFVDAEEAGDEDLEIGG